MTRPRILVDVDGVLADFLTPCLQAVEAQTGRSYHPDDVSTWDIMDGLCIDEETSKAIYASMQFEGMCLGMSPYEGARVGVDRLRSLGDVWAVTSPFGGTHWMHERDAWLVKHMGFHKDQVLHVRGRAKHAVRGNVLIEDKVSTLREWRASNPYGIPLLFERRYNLGEGWDGLGASNWDQILDLVETGLRS